MAGGNIGDAMQVKLRGNILSFVVKNGQTIYRGGAVVIDTAAGTVLSAGDDVSRRFVGMAEENVVGDGTKRIRVRRRGVFKLRKEGDSVVATEIGDVVCAQDNQTSSQDQTFESLSAASNDVVVGVVVGVDLTADRWWVDIIAAGFENYNMSSYKLTSDLASYTAGKGAELLGVEANSGYGATPTLQDALEALVAKGHIDIPLGAFTLVDGTALLKQAGTVAGFEILSSKETTIQYPNDEGTLALAFGGIAMPQDFDEAEGFTVHFLAEKSGNNNADLTFDLVAYMAAVGDSNNLDANDTSLITMTNAVTTIQELVFTCGAGAGVVLAPPCSLSGVISVVTAGTDNVNIHAAWIEYTRDLS